MYDKQIAKISGSKLKKLLLNLRICRVHLQLILLTTARIPQNNYNKNQPKKLTIPPGLVLNFVDYLIVALVLATKLENNDFSL
jgi:hypothetical protein